MRKLILVVAILPFILASCQKKEEDFKRVGFERYNKEIRYISLEPLMAIWWTDVNNSKIEHPYKKFSKTDELRTIVNELDILSENKKEQSVIPAQSKSNILRIYFCRRNQVKFRILEIGFALDPDSNEIVTSYGRSAKLYELLSLKEESENYWGTRHPEIFDSNEYKQHWRDSRDRMRNSDPNG